jgi:hypothetical protein
MLYIHVTIRKRTTNKHGCYIYMLQYERELQTHIDVIYTCNNKIETYKQTWMLYIHVTIRKRTTNKHGCYIYMLQ